MNSRHKGRTVPPQPTLAPDTSERRIRACLKACEGIATETLEAGGRSGRPGTGAGQNICAFASCGRSPVQGRRGPPVREAGRRAVPGATARVVSRARTAAPAAKEVERSALQCRVQLPCTLPTSAGLCPTSAVVAIGRAAWPFPPPSGAGLVLITPHPVENPSP